VIFFFCKNEDLKNDRLPLILGSSQTLLALVQNLRSQEPWWG